jgi:hypothetical protein
VNNPLIVHYKTDKASPQALPYAQQLQDEIVVIITNEKRTPSSSTWLKLA